MVWVNNMYVFDAHCDYLWKKALNEESALKQGQQAIKKSVFAVFEGGLPDENL